MLNLKLRMVIVAMLVMVPMAGTLAVASAAETSRDAPAAFGDWVTVGDWDVRVVRTDFDATPEVMAENQFNDPPVSGNVFVLANFDAVYHGDGLASPMWDLSFNAVGDSAIAYSESDPGCGVIPNHVMNQPNVFPGGSVSAGACWSVASADIPTLVMFVEAGFGDDRQFVALAPDGSDRIADAMIMVDPVPTPPAPTYSGADLELGGRGNPIPLGTTAKIGNWNITVTGVTPDATQMIMTENMFNDPPTPGRQFMLIGIKAEYLGGGEDTANLWIDTSFHVVGDRAAAYGSSDSSCGVIPGSFMDLPEVFEGGIVEGNVCFSVPTDEVDSFILMGDEGFSFDSTPTFFALKS